MVRAGGEFDPIFRAALPESTGRKIGYMAKRTTSKSKSKAKKTQHIGAKPLHTHDSAPPIHFRSEPGIHTRYDAFGGMSKHKTSESKREAYKSEIEYDAKVWLAERKSDSDLKTPSDQLFYLGTICAERAAAVLSWSKELKERTALGRASFTERFVVLNSVYVLSAVHQNMRDLLELSALDRFCIDVLTSSLNWIFRWVWSITGRRPDCHPIAEVISHAIAQAAVLNFDDWSREFGFYLFQDADPFPGRGRFCLEELLPDDYDIENELQRVVLELMHEHKAIQGKDDENQKQGQAKPEADLALKEGQVVPKIEPPPETPVEPPAPGTQDAGSGEAGGETDGERKNEVSYDEKDPAYEFNAKAINRAKKVGQEHDINELKKLNPDRMRRLLRRSGCPIKFMSLNEHGQRPHGRVHRGDWANYLKKKVTEAERFDSSVDARAHDIAKQLQ